MLRHEDKIGWLEDALAIIEQYRVYSEEMRKWGHGASPVGLKGHSVENVILGLQRVIQEEK